MKKLSEIEITDEIKEKASKCTTAEEFIALAQEYDVELTQEEIDEILKSNTVKELDDGDLELVSGGQSHAESVAKYLPKEHGRFIDRYDAAPFKGQKVYLVKDADREWYYWGTLMDSYEHEFLFGISERKHVVYIEGCNRYWRIPESDIGTTQYFHANKWSLFLYR